MWLRIKQLRREMELSQRQKWELKGTAVSRQDVLLKERLRATTFQSSRIPRGIYLNQLAQSNNLIWGNLLSPVCPAWGIMRLCSDILQFSLKLKPQQLYSFLLYILVSKKVRCLFVVTVIYSLKIQCPEKNTKNLGGEASFSPTSWSLSLLLWNTQRRSTCTM